MDGFAIFVAFTDLAVSDSKSRMFDFGDRTGTVATLTLTTDCVSRPHHVSIPYLCRRTTLFLSTCPLPPGGTGHTHKLLLLLLSLLLLL